MIATCNECGFKVPWDEIGRAIMEQHLADEHGHKKMGRSTRPCPKKYEDDPDQGNL